MLGFLTRYFCGVYVRPDNKLPCLVRVDAKWAYFAEVIVEWNEEGC